MPRLQGARLHLDLVTTHPDSCQKLYARCIEDHWPLSAGSSRDNLEKITHKAVKFFSIVIQHSLSIARLSLGVLMIMPSWDNISTRGIITEQLMQLMYYLIYVTVEIGAAQNTLVVSKMCTIKAYQEEGYLYSQASCSLLGRTWFSIEPAQATKASLDD
jgi:hypothetical protein